MRRGLLALLAALCALAPGAQAAERPHFHACRDAAPGARCGHVRVPLDRLAPGGEKIRIGFELYRRRDRGRPALGTLVDVEGGPGYATTDSRDYFLELSRPLMDRRDLLLVDARGTGLSGPLDCPALRHTVAGYIRRAGRCAAQLGPRIDRYTTRASVDDLADVLDALGIGAVDFYGDSYGSYFGQAFAVNHPGRLRSLVLDGTYPLPGTDPALGDLAEATWRALRLVCERRPSCAARGEDPLVVLGRLAERIRAHPVRGTGTDAEGGRIRVRVDIDALVTLAQSGYGNSAIYRDLLAAVRAFEDGDRAPLLRLVAETTLVPEASPVRSFSEALYLAVTCHDYRQMWDPAAPLATRRRQLAAARAAPPAASFDPFTGTEWTSLSYEGATACLRWPGPLPGSPLLDPIAAGVTSPGAGSRTAFEAAMLDPGTPQLNAPRTFTSAPQMRDFIKVTPNAWGYVDLAFAGELNVVAFEGIPCTRATVASEAYPARTELGFVTRGAPKGRVARFIRWVKTARKARQVIATRYVPVR